MSESCGKTCEDLREDLVALAWEKLEGDAHAEIKRHVESCDGCRSELDKLRTVRRAVRSVTEIDPGEDLHARIMAHVEQRVTPTGVPAAGPASRKLAILTERDRPHVFTPRQRMIAYLCSAAAAAVLLAFQAWKVALPRRADPVVTLVDDRPEGRIIMARWQERRECPDTRTARLEGTTIDVSGVLDDGEIVLTGVVDLERHERCLMAFKASEWKKFARLSRYARGDALAARERRRFGELDSNRSTAAVRGGRLEVPQAMFDRYIGEAAGLVLLRLKGRAEIWSREAYETYTRNVPPVIEIDTSDIGALEMLEAPEALEALEERRKT